MNLPEQDEYRFGDEHRVGQVHMGIFIGATVILIIVLMVAARLIPSYAATEVNREWRARQERTSEEMTDAIYEASVIRQHQLGL